jgi:hypothetical protein
MLARFRPRLSYANVMATIAVFLALGGGAYAVSSLPKNSVGTKQLKDGAVTNPKLAKRAVTGAKVANKSLTGQQINAATLGTVRHATNSDRLGGSPASAYLTGTVGPAQFGTLPAVRVTNSTSESIPNSSNTVLTFDTNEYDNAGMHSTSTNTSRLTAPVSGVYEVVGDVAWAEKSTGGRTLAILKNGSTNVGDSSVSVNSGVYGTEEEVTTQVRLSAGDYVVLSGFQNSGGPLNANQDPDYSPVFAMHWLGP